MAKIEINTTQNVTIEYELAALSERIFAYFIDQVIIWCSILALWLIFSPFVGGVSGSFFVFLVLIPIFVFYTLACEVFMDGQSFGKRTFGVKVVKVTGGEPGLNDYLIRWTFRMIDIYLSFGTLASLLIGSSSKHQRLGDLLANTAVIRIRSSFHLRLKDLMKIESLEGYEISYPDARQFSEQDMLLIKNVIARSQRYPNQAHKDTLYDLVTSLMKKLQIEERPKDTVDFLKTLIRDYIVLTR